MHEVVGGRCRTFLVFAIAAILWSAGVLAWVFSLASRRTIWIVSAVALAAAIASIASDLRALSYGRAAQPSALTIRLTRRGDWWQLDYTRPDLTVTTANELHVPAGTAVRLTWSGPEAPSIDDAVCLPRHDACTLVVDGLTPRDAVFASLWPPSRRALRVVPEPPAAFERWLQNETRPARLAAGNGPFLFVDSGCGYCHVLRGVTESPEEIAPDLTHFAARRTIAGTSIPIGRGTLSGWVVHSRGLKRSSAMPDNAVDPRTLHPLISYLESLR